MSRGACLGVQKLLDESLVVDIFVSYASDDRERVEPLVRGLTDCGWDVWWDQSLHAGPRYDEEIESALDQAKVVLVLWSASSVQSDWVRNEAATGLEREVLLPALLDDVRVPLAFRRCQSIDVAPLTGDAALSALVGELVKRIGRPLADPDLLGRDEQMHELLRLVDVAAAGSGRLCLVSGEPGIGKTRLLEALQRSVRHLDVQLHWGYSYEDVGLPPYFPWIQILRECLNQCEPPRRDAIVERWSDGLGALMPEFAGEGSSAVDNLQSEHARMQVYVAVSQVLFELSADRPMVLLFDNAHLLDQASIKLLEFIARQLRERAIAVIATYRDTDVDRTHPLFFSLRQLVSDPATVRMELHGLGPQAVAELVAGMGVTEPHIVLQVQDRAEGNPLFATELTRVLNSTGSRGTGCTATHSRSHQRAIAPS